MSQLFSCIGCHQKKDKKDLLRIVCTSDGEVVLDERGHLPGRGAYVCDDADCMGRLIKKHGLNRTFRREILREQYQQLEEQFVKRNKDR